MSDCWFVKVKYWTFTVSECWNVEMLELQRNGVMKYQSADVSESRNI